LFTFFCTPPPILMSWLPQKLLTYFEKSACTYVLVVMSKNVCCVRVQPSTRAPFRSLRS
jgi:hypothetical protein